MLRGHNPLVYEMHLRIITIRTKMIQITIAMTAKSVFSPSNSAQKSFILTLSLKFAMVLSKSDWYCTAAHSIYSSLVSQARTDSHVVISLGATLDLMQSGKQVRTDVWYNGFYPQVTMWRRLSKATPEIWRMFQSKTSSWVVHGTDWYCTRMLGTGHQFTHGAIHGYKCPYSYGKVRR